MCGIAGLMAWGDRFRATRALGERLLARIAHRGPDGRGIWLSHEGEPWADRPQVLLAHARLAILDLEERSNQPLVDERGNWIVFNGEIYNYRELRAELSGMSGEAWKTSGDTEVLLRAYAQWGKECLSRLNGMFAFAIWDASARKLFVARDRMGQKPLYYAHDPAGGFAFASGPGALLELEWVNRQMNPMSLVGYLAWGYVLPYLGSIYRGIGQVAPGEWMSVGAGGVERGSYFDPNAAAMEACEDASALAARAREMVCGAVRKQLVADVPVGCFLSGGVDSSIIAAAMKSAVGKDQRVLTFSIGFDDARYDETAYAAEVARHLGTEHREFRVRANAAEDLPKIAAAFEEPFGDSSALPTHYLARETRKHVKVALSGDGGDELFGGYDRYRAMRLAERLGSFGRGFVQSVAPLLRWMSSHPKSRAARLRRFSESLHLRPTWRYGSYLRLFDTEALQQLLKPHVMDLKICYQAENWIALRFGDTRADVAEAAMAVDRVTYLPGDLLTKVDRCSMMYALEVRSPFMDHELVRWAAGLPARVLFDGRPKRLLRLGFEKDLPASVFRRKKMGFAVPIGDWFCGELRDTLRDALFSSGSFAEGYFERAALERMIAEHESRAVDHSQRLYGLLMLELWWKGRT